MNPLIWIQKLKIQEPNPKRMKAQYYNGQKMVVTNIVLWKSMIFNFHQANIRRGFYKLYSK
jgi:hypothetical protein